MTVLSAAPRCVCDSNQWVRVHRYTNAPPGEIKLDTVGQIYARELYRCGACGHYTSVRPKTLAVSYQGGYVDANYRDEEGIFRAYQRVLSLPSDQSDNAGRVKSVLAFASDFFSSSFFDGRKPSVLDIGSGLGVFLKRMKENGWNCTALDPDERAVRHARAHVAVRAIHGDFLCLSIGESYDLVTLNKVLEHVEDPVRMLRKTRDCLREGGFVYAEVPDGETAMETGPLREEFFIDHLHVFSRLSAQHLASKSGLDAKRIERVTEPSGKYTLRLFMVPL